MLGEYLAEGAIAPIVMIRTGYHKLIHCPVDPDQLYDLRLDPDERSNIAATAADVAARMQQRARRTWDLDSLNKQVLASQRRRRQVYAALRLGRQTAWDYQPRFDATQEYVRNDKSLEEQEASARFPRIG